MDSEPEEVVMMPFDRHWNTDDVLIFTKSEMAANRVMNSISDWLERKLFLKVNATSCGYNQEAENHLQKPKLSKREEPKRIESGRYS